MNRRHLLAATVLPLTAGCLLGNFGRDDTPSVPESRGPVRGRSEPIETRTVESGDEVEYVDGEDAVRYVAARRHTNGEEIEDGEPPEREPVYETVPFEEWAETQGRSAAARAAAEHANAALDTDEVGGGITSTVESEDVAAYVSVGAVLDRSGDVVHRPEVAFEALVAATPRTVHATYVLEGHEYDVDAPVYARYEVLHQL